MFYTRSEATIVTGRRAWICDSVKGELKFFLDTFHLKVRSIPKLTLRVRQGLHASFRKKYHTSFRPMRTPMTEAIISPRVQPLESPRQCSPAMEVLKSVSIFTRLE